MPLPNPGMTFTPFDPLPASDLNDIVENIAALQDWSAYDVNTFPQRLILGKAEGKFDYVASGCVLTGTGYGSTLGWSLTAGVVYINGNRYTVAAASGNVTASRDTYFDILEPVSGTVATLVNTSSNIVTNNNASPALAANSVRIGIIQSGANIASVAAVNQGQDDKVLPIVSSIAYTVTDSLGNLICPRDPQRKVLGYRKINANFVTSATSPTQVTGLSCPVIVPVGRKVKVTGYAYSLSNTTANVDFFSLYDGAVGGTRINLVQNVGTVVGGGEIVQALTTPTTASKTYNASLHTPGGNATLAAGSDFPAYILVELE